ncbi:endonuclease VII domain-containing protein [Streptosporangium sp. NPDC002721]|uniref:endonuclease VII domain-containing protein n=1 Tax=Streptosporangium sp. NPDC002721 TaxID=3366188 RepID=UPI0036B8FBA8
MGYCKTHYGQLRNKGRVWIIGSRQGRAAHATCIVYACGDSTVQWGYCTAHIDEWLGRCIIHWCDEPIRYKKLGLCDAHARQNRWFSHKYGITISERYLLAERQNHQCATCSAPDERGALNVDHCHDTGKVRGLLCGNCNRAIGLFNHNPAALKSAAEYLEKAHGVD